ncbi:unnamed protein product, partial [Meganyctiphanes norvegica]
QTAQNPIARPVRHARVWIRTGEFCTYSARTPVRTNLTFTITSRNLSSCNFVPKTYENLTDNVAVIYGSPWSLSKCTKCTLIRQLKELHLNHYSTIHPTSSHRQHFSYTTLSNPLSTTTW